MGGALAHPARLEIIDLLAQGEKSVESLATGTGLSVKNVSAHLRTLRESALVSTRKEGTWVIYRLADSGVHDLLVQLQSVGRQQLADVREIVREYFNAPQDLQPLTLDELSLRLNEGSVTLVDVRPADEYRQGHIPGALSIPLAELGQRIHEVPHHREVVAYCRGPYCVLAVEAARRFGRLGFRARRLAEGLPAWARRGFPVTTGTASGAPE